MPVTNVGTLATDQEYATVKGFPEAGEFGSGPEGTLASIIIRAVEAAVRREVNVAGEETEIEGEEYTIAYPTLQDDIIVRRQTAFMLRSAPVETFTALRIATARSATDGSVTSSLTVPRNAYHVELSTGIVRELEWSLLQTLVGSWPLPYYGLPPGTMMLLADYTALAPASGDAAQMKVVCLMMASRLFNQFKNNRWDVASLSFDGTSTSYLDCYLTKQEMGHLSSMKRGIFPSFH